MLLVAGCGGHARTLADGTWFGRLRVSHGTLDFTPACRFASHRWTQVREPQVQLAVAAHAALSVYDRPAGHEQAADLRLVADVAPQGHWFVTVRGGRALAVEEDSGIRSSARPSACPST